MSVLSIPNVPFASSRFGLEANTQTFTSPLTKTTQVNQLSGSRWVASYTTPWLNRAQQASIKAFLLRLSGQANTFYAYDPDCKLPLGIATGSPQIMGANQLGVSLITDGWTNSITGILKTGDLFQVGTELKMVTADVNSDGSGQATINFMPSLRSAPTDNANIITNTPKCIMRLTDDQQGFWEANHNGLAVITFSGVEAFW